MDEALLLPSPNWFLVSNFAVSSDGWMIYGAPSKSICILEPRTSGDCVIAGNHNYQAHVVPRTHNERVVSVDISPEFPVKRHFLSGSADGTCKQWVLEKVNNKYKAKQTLSHEVHHNEKEEVVSVGYSTETIAITVGSNGNVVKWDLNSNVCKTYTKFTTNFRPTCMACSPHIPLNVAIGTKQGVIFVLDLEGKGKIVAKVRSQDDEITNLSWCPQFEVLLSKSLKESSNLVERKSTATKRMEAIRKEGEDQLALEQSGIIKMLPEDSFDESVVEEDDMFDIYKDHEADEFGHKKYEPEDILVKVKQEKNEDNDYLAECLKLKEEILKRKNQDEQTIESLVEAMDKTHVERPTVETPGPQASTSEVDPEKNKLAEASVHVQKHLLATIGKYGTIRIWSKSGKMVASCTVPVNSKIPKNKSLTNWPTVLWYKPDILLIADGKSQLLECNPLKIDSKNKVEWKLVHTLHKRGLFAIVSDAPRVQTTPESPEAPESNDSSQWTVYTISQDRNIIQYSMADRKKLSIHNTCGGFLYNVQPCPYDAGKLAISVGDGAIRVWQTTTLAEEDTKLYPARVQSYWQNVQGKVLTVAWHPTRENLLAFGTAEARVGVLDTSGKTEKPARVLYPALNGGVYSLCWGQDKQLYACGGGNFVVYDTTKDEPPQTIEVVVEDQKWSVGSAKWDQRGLLCGTNVGAVGVLDPTTYDVITVAFPFTKLIHSMEWHPIQTSNSSEESQYQNLIAVCSLDKNCSIIILEFKDKEDGGKQLSTYKTFTGHKMPVLQLAWSPHRDELLLSTSQDTTVRVWDITSGSCVSIFGGHSQHSLGAAWLALPQLDTHIVSGGGDYCLRLWDYNDHRPEDYQRLKHETANKLKKAVKKKQTEESKEDTDQQLAAKMDTTRKPSKRFILPITHRQMNPCPASAVKKVFQRHVERETSDDVEKSDEDSSEFGMDFIKMFGTINEVNEMLDMELENLLGDEQLEGWITLSIVRGHIDSMIQFASQRDMLCPYLLTQAPCVSFKYWKDVTQLYIAQIDRLVAKQAEDKLCEARQYGGAVYKKVTTLLSIHDVIGAVNALTDAKLFKEAYVLCRIRYMDSIARDTLEQWAKDSYLSGDMRLSAVCYIVLGKLSEAATVLAKYHDQETLSIAADLAKAAGRNTFADHVVNKAQSSHYRPKKESKENLGDLPSRAELLLQEALEENIVDSDDDVEDGDNVGDVGDGDKIGDNDNIGEFAGGDKTGDDAEGDKICDIGDGDKIAVVAPSDDINVNKLDK